MCSMKEKKFSPSGRFVRELELWCSKSEDPDYFMSPQKCADAPRYAGSLPTLPYCKVAQALQKHWNMFDSSNAPQNSISPYAIMVHHDSDGDSSLELS
jgi:hypothetical protein